MSKNRWIPFGQAVLGASHERKGTPIQDAILYKHGEVLNESTVKPSIVAVSDGHGGSKYIRSHIGSQIAVNALKDVVYESVFLSQSMSGSELEDAIRHLKSRFLLKWQNKIDIGLKTTWFNENELAFLNENCSKKDHDSVLSSPRTAYGCTLLCVIAYKDLILVMQYGDGDSLGLYINGEIKELIEPDPRNFGNATLSLSSLKNPSEIQHKVLVGGDIPALITLSTDGVKNSYDDKIAEEIEKFYQIPSDIGSLLNKHNNDIALVGEILDKELARMTKGGSGDDATLGVLFNSDKIKSLAVSDTIKPSTEDNPPDTTTENATLSLDDSKDNSKNEGI